MAAFAGGGDGHEGGVAVLPVAVLQHLRRHRQDEREHRLAAEAARDAGKSKFAISSRGSETVANFV